MNFSTGKGGGFVSNKISVLHVDDDEIFLELAN
jgi:hypothetical protein